MRSEALGAALLALTALLGCSDEVDPPTPKPMHFVVWSPPAEPVRLAMQGLTGWEATSTYYRDGTRYGALDTFISPGCDKGFVIGNFDAEWSGAPERSTTRFDVARWTSGGFEVLETNLGLRSFDDYDPDHDALCVIAWPDDDVQGPLRLVVGDGALETIRQERVRECAVRWGQLLFVENQADDRVLFARALGSSEDVELARATEMELIAGSDEGSFWLWVADDGPGRLLRFEVATDGTTWQTVIETPPGFDERLVRLHDGRTVAFGDFDSESETGRPYVLSPGSPPQLLVDMRVFYAFDTGAGLLLTHGCEDDECDFALVAADGQGAPVDLALSDVDWKWATQGVGAFTVDGRLGLIDFTTEVSTLSGFTSARDARIVSAGHMPTAAILRWEPGSLEQQVVLWGAGVFELLLDDLTWSSLVSVPSDDGLAHQVVVASSDSGRNSRRLTLVDLHPPYASWEAPDLSTSPEWTIHVQSGPDGKLRCATYFADQ